MASTTRTTAACLVSVEQDMRTSAFTGREPARFRIDSAELDLAARQALIDRVRRAEVAENAGAAGIITAVFGLLWFAWKCAPSLFPAIFY